MLLSLAFIPLLFVAGQDYGAQPGDEMRAQYTALKAAEEKKDTDAIIKHAASASKLAQDLMASKEPAKDVDAWKTAVEMAKEVGPYADYAVYAAALREPDKVTVLYEALAKQNPKSKYVGELTGNYMAAITAKPGGAAKAWEFANKAIAQDPNNEDLLAVLADGSLSRKQFDRAAMFGTKLATTLSSHPKPESMSAGDWERRKSALIARGYYIAGIAYASGNRWGLADKSLRAAVPFVKGDAGLYGPTLFYLGLSNYQLARITADKARMREALNFSEESVKAGGPTAQSASQNVYAIRQELSKMR